jgi:hypothetical protein
MDFQDKLRHLAETAEKAAQDAVHKAGDLANDKRDAVAANLDKVAAKVDEKTGGKYTDKVTKAKETISKGVDKLADQRHSADPETEPPAPGETAPGESTDPAAHEPPA